MTSKSVAELLIDLDVHKTHSRPHVSNDNPYSEAQFKTLKYRPEFPERFGSVEDARQFCRDFASWYNNDHRHGGLAMLTPATVHQGRAEEVLAHRHQIMVQAYAAHPERFSRPPVPQRLPQRVWITRPPRHNRQITVRVAPGHPHRDLPVRRDAGGCAPPCQGRGQRPREGVTYSNICSVRPHSAVAHRH